MPVHMQLLINNFKAATQKVILQRWHSRKVFTCINAAIISFPVSSILCCHEYFLYLLPASLTSGTSCNAKCFSVMDDSPVLHSRDSGFSTGLQTTTLILALHTSTLLVPVFIPEWKYYVGQTHETGFIPACTLNSTHRKCRRHQSLSTFVNYINFRTWHTMT